MLVTTERIASKHKGRMAIKTHAYDSASPSSESDRTNHQERQMIAHGKWRTTISNIAYNSIYLFIFVTFVSRLVNGLQLPQHQQQTDIESLLQQQETRCLSCIRTVSSAGIDVSRRCEGYYCGPYQISYQYWAEAGKPGNSQGTRDYEKCARDKQCAESTVKAYFKKFKRDCNNDGVVDCLDMAALHKGGPQSCSLDWFYKSRYWQAFNKTTCAIDRDPVALALQKPSVDKKDQISAGNQNGPTQAVMKNQTLTSECLDCICEALTSCSSSQSLSASNCGSGTVCGPFAISQSYWKDGRRPGASWTACARTKECSMVTIRNYMDKHKRDCNGDGFVTCEDYAAIHRRGPKSCMNRDLLREQFWTRFLACRANQKPNNDANLVKVDDDENTLSSASLASRGVPTISASTTVQQQTSPSPSTITTPAPPTLAPSVAQVMTTRVNAQVRPGSQQPATNRYDYSPTRASTPTHIINNPSSIAYDLSPVLVETKQLTSNGPVKTYQTAKPTAVKSMTTISTSNPEQQHDDSQALSQFILAHTHNVSPHEMSPSKSSSSSPAIGDYTRPTQTTKIYQDYTEAQHRYQHNQQSRPAVDYSSLPTIIVSKPLGSVSTNRVSQAPPSYQHMQSSSHDNDPQYSQTPAFIQTTASMTTTMGPQPSIASSFATNSPSFSPSELDAATPAHPSTTGSEYPSINQQVPGLASAQDDAAVIDYGAPDFEPSGSHSSFDRVVTDIVGNPNFSKVYPPVPELVQQRKQPNGPPPPTRGPSSSTSISQSSLSTRFTDQSASSSTPLMTISSTTASSNKRENSKTLSPNIYTVSGDSSSAHQADVAASILTGPDALNMTSLFDKGGLNETSRIPSECLDCICDASSNCDTTVQCISKQREKNRCGMYMISWNQYKESDISLTTLMSSSGLTSGHTSEDYDEKLYYECSTDRNCAEKLIHLYIEKYSKDCNHDGKIDCYDIAAIHRVGPDSCNSHKFLGSQYWRDFNHCYATDRLATTTTIQPQATSSQSVR